MANRHLGRPLGGTNVGMAESRSSTHEDSVEPIGQLGKEGEIDLFADRAGLGVERLRPRTPVSATTFPAHVHREGSRESGAATGSSSRRDVLLVDEADAQTAQRAVPTSFDPSAHDDRVEATG